MNKIKIAMSLDPGVVEALDKSVDGKNIRSRSHAAEYLLQKALLEKTVTKAFVMLRADQHKMILAKKDKQSFLDRQLNFLKRSNITTIILCTQPSSELSKIKSNIEKAGFTVRVYASNTQNNSQALLQAKSEANGFVAVISGDVLNNCELASMIEKHIRLRTLVTIGIMSKAQVKTEGSAIVDGDFVVDFREKDSQSKSNIVNTGLYIFKPETFELLEGKQNIEYELFPKLAKIKQLGGHFIYGEYEHLR